MDSFVPSVYRPHKGMHIRTQLCMLCACKHCSRDPRIVPLLFVLNNFLATCSPYWFCTHFPIGEPSPNYMDLHPAGDLHQTGDTHTPSMFADPFNREHHFVLPLGGRVCTFHFIGGPGSNHARGTTLCIGFSVLKPACVGFP